MADLESSFIFSDGETSEELGILPAIGMSQKRIFECQKFMFTLVVIIDCLLLIRAYFAIQAVVKQKVYYISRYHVVRVVSLGILAGIQGILFACNILYWQIETDGSLFKTALIQGLVMLISVLLDILGSLVVGSVLAAQIKRAKQNQLKLKSSQLKQGAHKGGLIRIDTPPPAQMSIDQSSIFVRQKSLGSRSRVVSEGVRLHNMYHKSKTMHPKKHDFVNYTSRKDMKSPKSTNFNRAKQGTFTVYDQ